MLTGVLMLVCGYGCPVARSSSSSSTVTALLASANKPTLLVTSSGKNGSLNGKAINF